MREHALTVLPKLAMSATALETLGVGSTYGYMNAIVPGAQSWFLSPAGNLAYTVPHSGYMPLGSQTNRFAAYENDALVDLGNPFGWFACPSFTKNTWLISGGNVLLLDGCFYINIFIQDASQDEPIWEYDGDNITGTLQRTYWG